MKTIKKGRPEFLVLSMIGFFLLIIFFVFKIFSSPDVENQAREKDTSNRFKSNRILVVIGEQWDDPESFFLSGKSDFKKVVVLLKSWCIPFDIIRLDEQKLDSYHFLSMDNRPKYGTVIWLAPPYIHDEPINIGPLHEMIQNHHMGFIALGESALAPGIQSLLGIRWIGKRTTTTNKIDISDHFITRYPLFDSKESHPSSPLSIPIIKTKEAKALALRENFPVMTHRKIDQETRCVWIGGDSDHILEEQFERIWLRRAIAETAGYAVMKLWKNHVILRMDDPGGAQNSWLDRWHYPTLTAEQIRMSILQPLKRHNARLSVFVVPGFINDKTQTVEPSWTQRFKDSYGTYQDYTSTKQGLDEGIAEGLIEVHSHGWTHMQPDLESHPGPWWKSNLNKQRAEEEWYREFYDGIRQKEIAASVQLRRMRISKQWIFEQFGQHPTAFIPGGFGMSHSPARNTWILASRAGFGWLDGYLGEDMAVAGWLFEASDDVPQFKNVPPDGHDFGLTREPEALSDYLKGRKQAVYIGYSDYIAYIHANIKTLEQGSIRILFEWDTPLCQALVKKESQWTLLLSDWIREKMRDTPLVLDINEQRTELPSSSVINISIPAGKTTHEVSLRPISTENK